MECGCGNELKKVVFDSGEEAFFCPNCLPSDLLARLTGLEMKDFEEKDSGRRKESEDEEEGDESVITEEDKENEEDGIIFGEED